MQTTRIDIDGSLCRHCRKCTQVCPASVVVWADGNTPEVRHTEQCIACGHCVDVCATGAIRHSAFAPECIHEVRQELLPSPQSLMELMRSRRSNRTITTRPISEQAMSDIMEAARYAPTAENTRRVMVTVLEKEDIKRLEDAVMRFFLNLAKVLMARPMRPLTRMLLPDLYREAPELERFRQRWENGECPCCCNANKVLVFSAPAGYDFAWQDCNLAYQNASLMAQSHGLTQIYLGLVQTALRFMPGKRGKALLHLPEGHEQKAIMALGHPCFTFSKYTAR